MSSLLPSSHAVASTPSSSGTPFRFSRPFSPSLPPFSLAFPLQGRRRCHLKLSRAQDSDSVASGGDSTTPNGKLPKRRRDILLEYVRNVQPEFMELFMKRAPQQVVDAMRQTVTNMIGTLPPQFFQVTVSTVAENLAQLMYSVMLTGYMFRNAQYRLELQQSLEQIALPDPDMKKEGSDHAPGTQKKVSGEVIRWNNLTGPEKIDAVKYIEYLEAEIEELNRQVAKKSSNGHNELLEYLKSLEPQNIKPLVDQPVIYNKILEITCSEGLCKPNLSLFYEDGKSMLP